MIFWGFFSFYSQSQDCSLSIEGLVINGETNEPLEGVSVAVVELNVGTITDKNGRFSIENVCKGKYRVVYSYIGYKSFSTNYNISKNYTDVVLLHTDTCALPSITIKGLKNEELNTFTKSTLANKDLDRSRGLSLGESLTKLSGVSVLQTGPSIFKPVIHGLHSNRIVILNAGLRQEGQQWGSEHAPEIDPYVSDKLVVVKGAAGVRYGADAMGGVVIAEPRALRTKPGMGGEINLAGFSNNRQGISSALIEGNFKKIPALSWRIQGTLKQAGNSRTPNYYMANTGFKEQNFSYSIGYNTKKAGSEIYYSYFDTQLGIFSGSHLGNQDDLMRAIAAPEPRIKAGFTYDIRRPYQHVTHELLRSKSYWNFGDGSKLNLILGAQFNNRKEYDAHRPYSDNPDALKRPQLDFSLNTYSSELVYEHKNFGKMSGMWGINYQRQDNAWAGRLLIPNFISHNYAAFAIEQWKWQKTELEAGIRYDYRSLNVYFNEGGVISTVPYTFSNISGTVGLNRNITEQLKWRNNIGTTFRPPSVNELYSQGLHHGTATWEYGDSNLKPEQAYKALSTLEFQNKKMLIEATGYVQLIDNFIYLRPTNELIQTQRGAFPVFRFVQGDAYFYGADLKSSYSINKNWEINAKLSAVNAWNLTEKSYQIFIPPYRADAAIVYKPDWKEWMSKNEAFVQLDGIFVARQFRAPNEIDYAPAPPAYFLANAEIGTNLPVAKQKMFISLRVANMFDEAYRDYMNRFRYFTDEPGRNIMLRIKIPINEHI